jgi:molybdopterin molybdotransferase
MTRPLSPSLASIVSHVNGYDPNALPIPQARAVIDQLVPRINAVEMLPLRAALGRVLARDVVSQINVPAYDNSAMDGYAFSGSELRQDLDTVLRINGALLAGDASRAHIGQGQCVRIMTGAVMPTGLDTVVPQELVKTDGEHITIPANILRPGDNRRLTGEDLAVGDTALKAGRLLRPADIGMLASLGQAEVAVQRKLRVAFFSTGNELRSIGEPLDEGCTYDSNRYTLWGMLKQLGVDILDLGIVRDDPQALAIAFSTAAANADVVITSGGVSVGEADHTKTVMAELGDVLFWRIAMRPGRPMAVGRICTDHGEAILFGLPGNPVAVMVTFYALVRDALLAMSGATMQPLPMLRCIATHTIRKKPGRTEYQRVVVTPSPDGDWHARITGSQGSGILRSMSEASGLLVLPHDQGNVEAGDWVDVLPFDGLI